MTGKHRTILIALIAAACVTLWLAIGWLDRGRGVPVGAGSDDITIVPGSTAAEQARAVATPGPVPPTTSAEPAPTPADVDQAGADPAVEARLQGMIHGDIVASQQRARERERLAPAAQ